jgi:sterol 3beta-glucosyltransferase
MTAVTIIMPGTEGDVRPFAALGRGLASGGCRVRVASTGNFAGLIRGAGLDFAPLSGDIQAVAAEHQAAFERGRSLRSMLRTAQQVMRSMVAPWAAEGLAACRDADLILSGGGAAALGASLAEALGRPFVQGYLQPHGLFASMPSTRLAVPRRPLPALANRAVNHTLDLLTWRAQRPAVNDVIRAELGLPAYPWHGPQRGWWRERCKVLYGFSPQIVPRPAAFPAFARITGAWVLGASAGWRPSAELAAFLEAGPKPVYIGFGSMNDRAAEALTALVVRAVALSGQRAILATGWGGLAAIPDIPDDRLLVIEGAPHDWLLPRCAAAVHHGGAGTSAAALRAGIPSVVIPFFGDQFFWAWRLEQLGVAPPHLLRDSMVAEDLAQAIGRAVGTPMQVQAWALGQRVGAEDGVAAAVCALRDWGLLPADSARRASA